MKDLSTEMRDQKEASEDHVKQTILHITEVKDHTATQADPQTDQKGYSTKLTDL